MRVVASVVWHCWGALGEAAGNVNFRHSAALEPQEQLGRRAVRLAVL